MPTGYTDVLDKTGNEIDWLKRILVRNFGVMLMLRDYGFDETTFEAMDKSVREPWSSGYHEETMEKAKIRLKKLRDLKEARKMYASETASKKRMEKKWRDEKLATKEIHDRAKGFLQAVRREKVSQFTKDVAQFGLDQLEVAKNDTEPYSTEPMLAFEYWVVDETNRCNHDIEYCEKEIAEEKETRKERIEFWEAFVRDMKMLEKKYGQRM